MTHKEYVRENNVLRASLNDENKAFYEDILVKIRVSAKEDIVREEILYEMLVDLLQAQKNGKNALEYFGKDSEELSTEIIDNLDKTSFSDFVVPLMTGLIIFIQINYTSKILEQSISFNLFTILGQLITLGIITYVVIRIILNSLYKDKSVLTMFAFLSIAFGIIILSFLGINYLTNRMNLNVEMSKSNYSWLVLIINVGIGIFQINEVKSKNPLFYLTTIFCIVLCLLGIGGLLNHVNSIWTFIVFSVLYITLLLIEGTLKFKYDIN